MSNEEFSINDFSSGGLAASNSSTTPDAFYDPRPVDDPEYISSCCLRVEDFVRSIAPTAILRPKAFLCPTVKDLEFIWETLFSAFDSKWCEKSKGDEIKELMPFVFESLGYPIVVSKSAVSDPGSTDSWPQILLALDWFVTVIEMKNSISVQDLNPTDAGQDLMRIEENEMLNSVKTFHLSCECYPEYMDVDDEESIDVDNALISKALEKHEQRKECNEKLRCEVEQNSAQVTALQHKLAPLLKVKREVEELEQVNVSLRKQTEEIEKLISRLQKKSAKNEAFTQKKRQETKTTIEKIEEIKEKMERQTLNEEDTNGPMNEKEKVEQMLENAITHKNSVEQEINNKEIQLVSLQNQLETIVHEYNDKVSETIPAEDLQSLDVDLFITLNRNATKSEELCDIEQKKRITNALLSLEQKYTEQNRALIEEGQRLESLYSQQLNKTVEIQQQHVELVSELERLRQESMRNKEALASFKQNGEDQLRLREDEIQRIKQHGVEMMQDVNQRVAEAEAAYQKLFEECEEEKQNVLDEQRKKVEIYKRVQRDVSAVSQRLRKVNEKAIKEAQDLIPKDKE